MHMARLADPTRGPKSYSLSALTSFYEKALLAKKRELIEHLSRSKDLSESQKASIRVFEKEFLHTNFKISMSKVFSRRRKLKTGEFGKTIEMPSIIELHTSHETIQKWVEYATLDAESTFFLREVMVNELSKYAVNFEDMKTLFDLYCKYWLPFGEVLTELERNGIKVNLEHLENAEKKAFEDLKILEDKFKNWLLTFQPELDMFNTSSVQQLQQLLYAPFSRIAAGVKKDKRKSEIEDINPNDFELNKDEEREVLVY